jgi:hypothetical protein
MNGARAAMVGTAGLVCVLASTGAEALPARAQTLCVPSSPGCTLVAARPDPSACRISARPVAKRTARNLLAPAKQRPLLAEPRAVPSRYVSLLVLGVGY